MEAFDQRGVELAPVVAAVAGLDVERADPGAFGAGRDPGGVAAFGPFDVPDPHSLAVERGRRRRRFGRRRRRFDRGRAGAGAAGAGGGARGGDQSQVRMIAPSTRRMPGTEVLLTLTSAVNTGAAIRCGRAGPSMERSPESVSGALLIRRSRKILCISALLSALLAAAVGPALAGAPTAAERRLGRPGRRRHLPGRQAADPLRGNHEPGAADPARPPPADPGRRVQVPLFPVAPPARARRPRALRRRPARGARAGRGLVPQRQGEGRCAA